MNLDFPKIYGLQRAFFKNKRRQMAAALCSTCILGVRRWRSNCVHRQLRLVSVFRQSTVTMGPHTVDYHPQSVECHSPAYSFPELVFTVLRSS
jgi:hypothetical protein